jgi:hypothetical protein
MAFSMLFGVHHSTMRQIKFNICHRVFKSRSGQTKGYTIGICCFSAEHTALKRKGKDWLARNQITSNVSEWGDISMRGLLFQ